MTTKKPRRFVRRRRHVPKIENLYAEASALGITVKEYVDYLNYMNMPKEQRNRRRNHSTSYDWGPLPYRDEHGKKIRDEKWEREKRARRKAASKGKRRRKSRSRES